MKKIVGIASAIAGIAVIAGICYFVYKHFFCCQCECDGEECECDGETCDVPDFASDCASLNHSNFGGFIQCSFNKIDTKSRERFGVLYSPVRFSQDIIGRLSNINAVSCNIRIHNYTASVCFI